MCWLIVFQERAEGFPRAALIIVLSCRLRRFTLLLSGSPESEDVETPRGITFTIYCNWGTLGSVSCYYDDNLPSSPAPHELITQCVRATCCSLWISSCSLSASDARSRWTRGPGTAAGLGPLLLCCLLMRLWAQAGVRHGSRPGRAPRWARVLGAAAAESLSQDPSASYSLTVIHDREAMESIFLI